jgi:hypothetical protein
MLARLHADNVGDGVEGPVKTQDLGAAETFRVRHEQGVIEIQPGPGAPEVKGTEDSTLIGEFQSAHEEERP